MSSLYKAAASPVTNWWKASRSRRLPVRHSRAGVLRAIFEYGSFALLALMELSRRRRYDIVHIHNPPDFLVLCAIPQRLRGARVILDIHDLAGDMYAARYGGGPTTRRVLARIEQIGGGHLACGDYRARALRPRTA